MMPAYQMVYTYHVGPYYKVGPVMDRIFQSLRTNENIVCTKGFGIYYDDPEKTHPEDCRSDVGCILEKKDYRQIPRLKKKLNP